MDFFIKAIEKFGDANCQDFSDIYDKISKIFFIDKEILRMIKDEEILLIL